MKVKLLLDQLSYGELRSIALGGSEGTGLQRTDYPKVIPHINLGLAEIYKRFPIRTKELVLNLRTGVTDYVLHEDYAVTNVDSTIVLADRYIADTAGNPFTDSSTVLKIDDVMGENGLPHRINDANNTLSVYTVGYNILQVPFAADGTRIGVTYRSGHPHISNSVNFLDEEVDISATYLSALLLFIGSRYAANAGTIEGMQAGLMLKQQFELACTDIARLGLQQEVEITGNNFSDGGWA